MTKGPILASHTLQTAGAAVAVELSIDVPSAVTGTGEALLLDGHDTGLVRATIIDAAGLTADADHLVTFAIESGPGKISGVHNGDAKSHEAQVADSRHAYHGLARAAVKVTHDALAPTILREEIEVYPAPIAADIKPGVGGVTLGEYNAAMEIVITATAVRSFSIGQSYVTLYSPRFDSSVCTQPGLKAGKVTIKVSSDAEKDAVLAVAKASVESDLRFE